MDRPTIEVRVTEAYSDGVGLVWRGPNPWGGLAPTRYWKCCTRYHAQEVQDVHYVLDGTIEVRIKFNKDQYDAIYSHLKEEHGFADTDVPLNPR